LNPSPSARNSSLDFFPGCQFVYPCDTDSCETDTLFSRPRTLSSSLLLGCPYLVDEGLSRPASYSRDRISVRCRSSPLLMDLPVPPPSGYGINPWGRRTFFCGLDGRSMSLSGEGSPMFLPQARVSSSDVIHFSEEHSFLRQHPQTNTPYSPAPRRKDGGAPWQKRVFPQPPDGWMGFCAVLLLGNINRPPLGRHQSLFPCCVVLVEIDSFFPQGSNFTSFRHQPRKCFPPTSSSYACFFLPLYGYACLFFFFAYSLFCLRR